MNTCLGYSETNALGEVTSTLVGAILSKQVTSQKHIQFESTLVFLGVIEISALAPLIRSAQYGKINKATRVHFNSFVFIKFRKLHTR